VNDVSCLRKRKLAVLRLALDVDNTNVGKDIHRAMNIKTLKIIHATKMMKRLINTKRIKSRQFEVVIWQRKSLQKKQRFH